MKITVTFMIFGITSIIHSIVANAQTNEPAKEPAISFKASYIGDVVSNLSGGIKAGTVYLGLANIKGDFNTGAANWWKGGEAFVNVGNTHGGEPSANLTGDFQGISNIEAGNHSFLYELWYKQNFKKVNITVGLQDLNANFATCENGAIFTNSSFGIHSSISDNVAPPIFPLTAPGMNVQWNMSDTFVWEAALFDGPVDFDQNPYNTRWDLNLKNGMLAITEIEINRSLITGKKGTYKFGLYYHQHTDTLSTQKRDGGFYFVGDQQINTKISVFTQVGLSPKKINKNNRYFSLGINCKAPFDKRPNDQLGLAFAYAGIDDNSVGSETAIELTYKLQLNKNIYLRPDLQYVINPAGTDVKLDNALVGFVRFGIDF